MADCVYEIEHLYKMYPGQQKPANRDINLQIWQGEIFGFLGDNGAGKTTLVRQMANLLKSTSGKLLLFGEAVESNPVYVSSLVGYMPQESYSLNNLTVSEALYHTARLRGLSHRDARHDHDRLLEIWQIGTLKNAINTRLSGGQRRLLRLAVAMVASPPVLLLDEPTNDLDPLRRKLVWENLRCENAENGTTILFITHDAIEAEKVIQRVGILHEGELVAVGAPGELKREVDQKLRLELIFAPELSPTLPAELTYHVLQPGRWLVYLEWKDAARVLDQLVLSQLDDFRLYSATLEDLYLHYANSKA